MSIRATVSGARIADDGYTTSHPLATTRTALADDGGSLAAALSREPLILREGAVLLEEVGELSSLVAIEPAGEGDDEELEDAAVHEGTCSRGGRSEGVVGVALWGPKNIGIERGLDTGLEDAEITPVIAGGFWDSRGSASAFVRIFKILSSDSSGRIATPRWRSK